MLFKKNKIPFLAVLLISTLYTYSQQKVKGKVVDSESTVELRNVRIVNKESKKEILSNSFGGFTVDVSGVYIFRRVGYRTKEIKHCTICKIDFSTMYRVQYKNPKEWVFLCKECLIDVKKDNPNYKYGWCKKKGNQIDLEECFKNKP